VPKCNKCEEDCHDGELIKRKKSVRAHKLPRVFVRWPLGPHTKLSGLLKAITYTIRVSICALLSYKKSALNFR
jgi:hypothetical protein